MKDYVGILVCQPIEVLKHKQTDGRKEDEQYCFWEMTRFPKKVKERLFSESQGIVSRPAKLFDFVYDEDDLIFEDFDVRLYFAVKGIVRGYFVCKACNKDLSELRFHSEDWYPITKQIKVKPSQGWRYFEE